MKNIIFKFNIKKRIYFIGLTIFSCLTLLPNFCSAMPPGALVYRTSGNGKMYGYSGDPLIYSEKGIIKNVYSGHVGIYIGKEDGIDYVVEALSGGIVKTPASEFVNLAEGEKYLGAKIPKNLSALQQAKVVALAKSLVGQKLAYDFDFKTQKGPKSGEWTCVGLTEKLYESANISNPNNLASLEYNPDNYAINITPDGFDNKSIVNANGDCFSKDYEFSKIARRTDLILPAPELIGFDVGLEHNGERYIFLPYTQFLQASLSDVSTDITISSSFSGDEVRGRIDTNSLVLRWSLINNPLSSLSLIAQKAKDIILSVKDKILASFSGSTSTEIALDNNIIATSSGLSQTIKKTAAVKKATAKSTNVKIKAVAKTSVKKAVAKTSATKTSSAKAAVATKVPVLTRSAAKSTAAKSTAKSAAKSKSASSSTVSVASYFSPVSAPVNTSSGSSNNNGASNINAADNYPKIATINKIYSTGTNNWIELYNTGDYDFDLASAGYRLEKAKTAEDPTLIMRIGNSDDGTYPGGTVIKAHSSYLIVKKTANAYYLAKAQAIATRDEFAWPNKDYTLYLGTDAISSSTDPNIVEALGFGSSATYYQGSGPAPEITDNYILSRVKAGNDNQIDFSLIESDDPSIDWNKQNAETASSTDEVASSTDETASSTDEVASSTDDSLNSSDENASSTNDESGTDETASSSPETSSEKLALIKKIYSTGKDNWIELFNPTNSDFDLAAAGYRLEKSKTAKDPSLIMRIGDNLDGTYPGGTIIKAQGTYLIVRNDASDFFKSRADAIATRTDFLWSDSDYSLYLGNGPISSNTDVNIMDLVGYGPGATYFKGAGPAPAIIDNYVLNRIGTSGNNNLDFDLIKSDDPSINWATGTPELDLTSKIYKFATSSYDLFIQPQPINSQGLVHLWHFSECNGMQVQDSIGSTVLENDGYWTSGNFDCASEAGYIYGEQKGNFTESIDASEITVSFWYKATGAFSRLSLVLKDKQGETINVTLDNDSLVVNGLPGIDWRYYGHLPFDDVWRQATLVISRSSGYWAFYVDGTEISHLISYTHLPSVDSIEVAGNNGPYAIDELAIWNRALSPDEIVDIKNNNEPFSPYVLREAQAIPILKHFWNFNEGIGTSTSDLIGNANIDVDENAWNNLDVTNADLNFNWNNVATVNFPSLKSSDLSITFWWRSKNISNGNRLRVALGNIDNKDIFVLDPDQYGANYYFNGIKSYFNISSNPGKPLDGEWHHLALVYDSYRYLLRYYVDGVKEDSRTFIWPVNRPLADTLEVLSENGNSEIDDLGVWEGALSTAQIKEIYANN